MADAIQALADWLFCRTSSLSLLGGGVFLTFRLGFVQIRRFGEAVRAMLARDTARARRVRSRPFRRS